MPISYKDVTRMTLKKHFQHKYVIINVYLQHFKSYLDRNIVSLKNTTKKVDTPNNSYY